MNPKLYIKVNQPNGSRQVNASKQGPSYRSFVVIRLIIRFTKHHAAHQESDMDIDEKEIRRFQSTISNHSGYDFSEYSVNSLKRRLSKLLKDYGADFSRLIRTIESDALALEEAVKKITVNTTELFRDPKIWQSILLELLPRFSNCPSINIWHPGCSTGQEVYSMMIVLDQLGLLDKSNIFASDLNADVLEKAKSGTYRLRFNREYIDHFNEVFQHGMNGGSNREYKSFQSYFSIDETRDQIRMHRFLREKPVYKKSDLVMDNQPFFLNFDIVICRNVIIYFNYELQNRVLSMFHRTMRENGCLVLGLHESIIGPGSRLFRKQDHFYVKQRP
jgi:chemotaxis protein methyltransferase CheR